MRSNGIFTKYCYKCGKILERTKKICPHCGEELTAYKKQEKIKCRYCRNDMPIGANFCKVCNTKNISLKHKKDSEIYNELKFAAEMYEKEKYPDRYLEQKMTHIKFNLNVYECLGKLQKAKRIFVKVNKEELILQTFEYGQELIKFEEIISCYRITKEKLFEIFNISISEMLPLEECIIINTTKGNIILYSNNAAEELLHCIYYNLKDSVVEFSDSFYNALFDDLIKAKYEKEVGDS